MSYRPEKGIQKQEQVDVNKQMTLNLMCNMLDLPLQNDESTDDTCPYCERPHHAREQYWMRKSEEILQQRGLKPHQEKMMRSTIHTLQCMTIGGNRIKKLMDTDRHDQGERMKSKENASRGL